MRNNTNLAEANKVKNDEFYTKLTDIEKELMHYKEMFVGKTIYCNCDDPVRSNFVQWFYMRFWLEKNRANRKNISDGQVWTYNSAEAFELLFPYMKARTIARYLRELEFDGVIISGVNSDNKLDRTKWYSTPDYSITKCDIPSSQNGESAESEFAYSNLTICDNVTDINKQIVNTNINNKDLKELSVSTKHDDTVKNIFAV
jgi:hypothetical protein